MKERNKNIMVTILKLLLAALTGGATAYTVSSCTVNSGNRENQSSPIGYPERMYIPRSDYFPPLTDTVKVIKETNTIYTND